MVQKRKLLLITINKIAIVTYFMQMTHIAILSVFFKTQICKPSDVTAPGVGVDPAGMHQLHECDALRLRSSVQYESPSSESFIPSTATHLVINTKCIRTYEFCGKHLDHVKFYF